MSVSLLAQKKKGDPISGPPFVDYYLNRD